MSIHILYLNLLIYLSISLFYFLFLYNRWWWWWWCGDDVGQWFDCNCPASAGGVEKAWNISCQSWCDEKFNDLLRQTTADESSTLETAKKHLPGEKKGAQKRSSCCTTVLSRVVWCERIEKKNIDLEQKVEQQSHPGQGSEQRKKLKRWRGSFTRHRVKYKQ